MSKELEMALEALEWADNFHNEGEPVQVRIAEAIAALKEAIKQQELPELEAMEYWLKCNPPAAGAGYAVCWQAACKWQREAIKNQGENSAIDAIYAAWHGAGVDIAGGDWKRFVGMLPPLYTSTLTIPAERALKEAIKNQGEPVAYIHKWKPHAAIIGKSLHFTDTSPHGDDVEIIPLYTSTPTIPAGMVLVRDGNSLAMLQSPDGRIFRIQQLGTGDPWGNAADNDELVAMLSAVPKGDKP